MMSILQKAPAMLLVLFLLFANLSDALSNDRPLVITTHDWKNARWQPKNRFIYTYTDNDQTCPLQDMPAGTYILHFSTKYHSFTKKIIKP